MSSWYLDSSAIVKLAVEEPESAALGSWLAIRSGELLVTAELAVTEVLRAVARVGGDLDVALAHLDSLEHVVVDRELVLAAGRLQPADLRSLDAIHLAAAAALGDDLAGMVTYDERLARAAGAVGVTTEQPGR